MKNLSIIAILCVLVQCEPVTPQQSTSNKQLFFDNHEYENMVGMTKIAPKSNGISKNLENPVIDLNSSDELSLTFDLLTDQFENLSAKIYHCNKDWDKSVLRDMEFLSQINNFRIIDFDYSVNTVQPYITYRFNIPKPIISGNYIISVFRRANPNDLILTRKFLIVDGVVSIDHLVKVSTVIDKRKTHQQLEYNISYGKLLVNSPIQDISTTILQNHNWLTAIKNVAPTLVRSNDGYIAYQHLDLTLNFPGWSEFRFTDLRTLNVSSRNVGKIMNDGSKIVALIRSDGSRKNIPYTRNFNDINGNYLIQNNDPGEVPLNGDYVNAVFSLKSSRVDGEVYTVGRFNDWRLTDVNRMKFLSDNGLERYETTIPLKQGYYEYLYYVKNSQHEPYYFEGSHLQTENEYEIIVYYRKPGSVNDQIVGYKKFRSIE